MRNPFEREYRLYIQALSAQREDVLRGREDMTVDDMMTLDALVQHYEHELRVLSLAPDITIIGGRVYRIDTRVPGTEVCDD